ncbi:hypothetical protein B0H17DRAFT_1180163 [Mycena rosella]|uniref:Uncharacterized protein n=1 Tax=Mycena rosella TaxID=1033263 RepID=A0AAD7DEE7_MYCRO|nr:hypothetical protein B0H17DRAFT_1180163 [Mycena rosella]
MQTAFSIPLQLPPTPPSHAQRTQRRARHRHTQSLGLLSPIPSRASLRDDMSLASDSSHSHSHSVESEPVPSTPRTTSRKAKRTSLPPLPALLASLGALFPAASSTAPTSTTTTSTAPPSPSTSVMHAPTPRRPPAPAPSTPSASRSEQLLRAALRRGSAASPSPSAHYSPTSNFAASPYRPASPTPTTREPLAHTLSRLEGRAPSPAPACDPEHEALRARLARVLAGGSAAGAGERGSFGERRGSFREEGQQQQRQQQQQQQQHQQQDARRESQRERTPRPRTPGTPRSSALPASPRTPTPTPRTPVTPRRRTVDDGRGWEVSLFSTLHFFFPALPSFPLFSLLLSPAPSLISFISLPSIREPRLFSFISFSFLSRVPLPYSSRAARGPLAPRLLSTPNARACWMLRARPAMRCDAMRGVRHGHRPRGCVRLCGVFRPDGGYGRAPLGDDADGVSQTPLLAGWRAAWRAFCAGWALLRRGWWPAFWGCICREARARVSGAGVFRGVHPVAARGWWVGGGGGREGTVGGSRERTCEPEASKSRLAAPQAFFFVHPAPSRRRGRASRWPWPEFTPALSRLSPHWRLGADLIHDCAALWARVGVRRFVLRPPILGRYSVSFGGRYSAHARIDRATLASTRNRSPSSRTGIQCKVGMVGGGGGGREGTVGGSRERTCEPEASKSPLAAPQAFFFVHPAPSGRRRASRWPWPEFAPALSLVCRVIGVFLVLTPTCPMIARLCGRVWACADSFCVARYWGDTLFLSAGDTRHMLVSIARRSHLLGVDRLRLVPASNVKWGWWAGEVADASISERTCEPEASKSPLAAPQAFFSVHPAPSGRRRASRWPWPEFAPALSLSPHAPAPALHHSHTTTTAALHAPASPRRHTVPPSGFPSPGFAAGAASSPGSPFAEQQQCRHQQQYHQQQTSSPSPSPSPRSPVHSPLHAHSPAPRQQQAHSPYSPHSPRPHSPQQNGNANGTRPRARTEPPGDGYYVYAGEGGGHARKSSAYAALAALARHPSAASQYPQQYPTRNGGGPGRAGTPGSTPPLSADAVDDDRDGDGGESDEHGEREGGGREENERGEGRGRLLTPPPTPPLGHAVAHAHDIHLDGGMGMGMGMGGEGEGGEEHAQRPAFNARKASAQCRRLEGYVSFAAVEGLGEPPSPAGEGFEDEGLEGGKRGKRGSLGAGIVGLWRSGFW